MPHKNTVLLVSESTKNQSRYMDFFAQHGYSILPATTPPADLGLLNREKVEILVNYIPEECRPMLVKRHFYLIGIIHMDRIVLAGGPIGQLLAFFHV